MVPDDIEKAYRQLVPTIIEEPCEPPEAQPCETSSTYPVMPHLLPFLDDISSSSSPIAPSSCTSPSYQPTEPSSSTEQEASPHPHNADTSMQYLHRQEKYIVFKSCLQSLIKWCHCPVCGSYDITPLWTTTGSQLSLILVCESCDKSSKWSSQPYIGAFPAGNILLSAGILFAGASAGKVLRVLNSIGVNTHSTRTFFDHQTTILQPAIKTFWEQEQQSRFSQLRLEGRPLVLGGDGRADSPGHCAKFGTYTSMDLVDNVILDLQLVQVSVAHTP